MYTEIRIDSLLNDFAENSKRLFGEKLNDIILFGSYARGDYDAESDVDIIMIADISEDELYNYKRSVADYTADLSLEYDVLVSPIIEPLARYQKYKDIIPFLNNIQKEGVSIGVS